MSAQSGVYVKDQEYGWLPASVISYEGDKVKISVSLSNTNEESSSHDCSDETIARVEKEEREIHLKDYHDGMLPLQNIDEGGNLMVVPDMCDLTSLHEAAILYNLKARHEALQPYTRVGDIVIAMNPFHWIESLYTPEKRDLYVDKLIRNIDTNGDCKASLDPHVYEVSSLAYRGLALDNQHQSILVSGESGAGKTETVKIMMSHLASIQRHDNNYDSNDNIVVKRTLDSNPLLEAFGNAKTIRNDNSSRFGKYIQLEFDVEDPTTAAYSGKSLPSCILAGSTCETYLLEKSRVVGHDPLERTYHIFYQLLAAPESAKTHIWSGLVNKSFTSFKYVGHTDTQKIENKTDGEKWFHTVEALALIGIKDGTFNDLMRAICVTMQLGNLTFEADPENEDGSIISSKEELVKLSELMGVDEESIKKALTFRTIYAPKESYSVPLRASTAKDSCDAFAKDIYQQTFDWLVSSINEATCAEKNYDDARCVEQYGHIGLLDIFGFEYFPINRFEQFCINYANEKLQSKYNLDIFSSVQDEYEYEGIAIPKLSFTDNSEVVNLIEGRMGLIAMLNEECLRPHGNDSSFVSKIKKVNQDIGALVHNPLHTPTQFGIMHYATEVSYEATYFVQKNTDTLPNDLIECALKSTNSLIQSNMHISERRLTGSRGSDKLSVSSKFRTQLTTLMANISATSSRYIRCIKPNSEKIARRMNLLSSLEQLRCAGVVAAVTVSRTSFPNRLTHESAIDRFECLYGHKNVKEVKEVVTDMMKNLLGDFKTENGKNSTSPFEIGKSRVYFKAGALEHLESRRLEKLGFLATKIQSIVRGFIAYSKYNRLLDTIIILQSLVRRNIARANLLRACTAVTSISCWIRCVFAKAKLLRLKKDKASTLIQTIYRTFSARKSYLRSQSAVILIQKICRGAIQRPLYRKFLKEAEEEARVNTKLAALQKRLADAEMKWIMADKARMEAEKRIVCSGNVAQTSSEIIDEKKEEEELSEKFYDQKALLDESTKMLDYLKKQVFEFRSKNFLLRSDLNEIKIAHHHLLEQYSSLTSSHEALRQQSSHLSKANRKLLAQSADSKKELFETKKELKISLFSHKAEMRKLTDLMKAKDKDNADTVAYLQAEIASLQSTSRHNSDRAFLNSRKSKLSGTSLSFQARKKNVNSIQSLQRAVPRKHSSHRFRDRFNRNSPINQSSPVASIVGNECGHDGYYTIYGSTPKVSPVSASSSNNSFSSSRKRSVHQKRQSTKIVAKDAQKPTENNNDTRLISSEQQNPAPPGRNTSISSLKSSLKDAMAKKSFEQKTAAKKSSLAVAAKRRSSLALKTQSVSATN